VAAGQTLTLGGSNLALTNGYAFFGAQTDTGTIILAPTSLTATDYSMLVDGGKLLVDADISSTSSMQVFSGGTLGGTGTVPDTTVLAGGTLMPGLPNSIGTLTVKGNLIMSTAASYLVQVSPTTASLTRVTGTASLSGTVNAAVTGAGYTGGQKFTLLTATGGVSGAFSNLAVSSTFGPAIRARLVYDANDVFLELDQAMIAALLPPGSSTNVLNVAGAIDNFIASGGLLPPGFANVFNFSQQQITTALTQLSGEAGAGAMQGGFQLANAFLSLLLDPSVDNRSDGFGAATPFAPERDALPPEIASVYAGVLKAADAPHFNVWGAAFGGTGSLNGDPAGVGSHDLTTRTGGFAAGLDYRPAPDTVVGFALAGGGSSWSLAAGLGSGRSDVLQAGVQGSRQFGAGYLAGALSYGSYWVSTNRTVTAAGIDQLSASFLAQDFAGRLEGGYHVPSPLAFGVTPYVALQAQSFEAPAYGERAVAGSPQFALSYNAKTTTAVRAEFGSRADATFALTDGNAVKLFGRLAVAHDRQSDPSLNAVFLGLPTASFVVNGATPPKDLLLLTAGAEWRLRKGWSLLAKLDGEFAVRSLTYSGTARAQYAW
jgi:outer membrane autotransporter protein